MSAGLMIAALGAAHVLDKTLQKPKMRWHQARFNVAWLQHEWRLHKN